MKLLTTIEVSERLSVSTQRVCGLIRDKILPSVRLGRQIRVSEEALEEWVNSGGRALPGGWRFKQLQIENSDPSHRDLGPQPKLNPDDMRPSPSSPSTACPDSRSPLSAAETPGDLAGKMGD